MTRAEWRVLIADDSPVNQEVAAGLLELFGHSVVKASSGREAIAAWERQAFDDILMDVEMHDIDGLTATAAIRDVRAAVLELRARKGMLLDPADPDSVSAGSFFTNPILDTADVPPGAPAWPVGDGRVKTSAAWLIEHAGFGRGYRIGPVGLSTKHTLALVNHGGASTSDLVSFARLIRNGVREAFGVTLEVEPALVGVSL